jgi:hypothetical protein
MHISELIQPALLPFNVLNGKIIPPVDGNNANWPASAQVGAANQTQNSTYSLFKVEEGDPVRSAERVPYSSSHYLPSVKNTGGLSPEAIAKGNQDSKTKSEESQIREQSASSSTSFCPGTTGTENEVAAA